MRNLPDAKELIEITRDTLKDTLAAEPSERHRYIFALILSALNIAERELNGSVTAWPREYSALKTLYPDQSALSSSVGIEALHRQFSIDLRRGIYDEPGQNQSLAQDILREDVLARLAEDNPHYIK